MSLCFKFMLFPEPHFLQKARVQCFLITRKPQGLSPQFVASDTHSLSLNCKVAKESQFLQCLRILGIVF